jgi:hypothetical protein
MEFFFFCKLEIMRIRAFDNVRIYGIWSEKGWQPGSRW